MSTPTWVKRVRDLGSLGLTLSRYLKREDIQVVTCVVEEQWRHIDTIASLSPLRAVATSVLVAKFPFQVPISKFQIKTLAQAALATHSPTDLLCKSHLKELLRGVVGLTPDTSCACKLDSRGKRAWMYTHLNDEARFKIFPVKGTGPAHTKTNVFFTDAWADLEYHSKVLSQQIQYYWPALFDMTNDQATAVLFSSASLSHYYDDAADLAARLVADPAGAKNLNVVLKAVGANSTREGAVLVEGIALRGRGEGALDRHKELQRRVDLDTALEDMFVPDDPARLEQIIRKIIDSEIAVSRLDYPTDSNFWQSRWLWCANGTHNTSLEKRLTGQVSTPADLKQVYRKVYAESTVEFPLDDWSGVSAFSLSEKMEHGKTRAIYGGDTNSYFAFERLLKPIERAWLGHRVILDPGSGGALRNVRRIRSLQKKGSVNMMMDYDDFNSAHTLASQQAVIRQLCEKVGYPKARADKLVASFGNSYVYSQGSCFGRLAGTLMSGHRATTIINSILNRAYLLYLDPSLESYPAMHVGDDVYVCAPSISSAASSMEIIASSSLRMNPSKQSIGFVSAEFLRLAVGRDRAIGYANRSIASIISGNWVGEYKLSPREGVSSLVASSWSLMNRAGSRLPALLCSTALRRYVPMPQFVSDGLLVGSIALGTGPVRTGAFVHRKIVLSEARDADRQLSAVFGNYPSHATAQYLSTQVSEIEYMALSRLGRSPQMVMVDSSYRKSLASETTSVGECAYTALNHFVSGARSCAAVAEELLDVDVEPGVLTRYPILGLYKNALNTSDLRFILKEMNLKPPSNMSLEMFAWGSEAAGVEVTGDLPYSDICALSKRTRALSLVAGFNISA